MNASNQKKEVNSATILGNFEELYMLLSGPVRGGIVA